MVVLHLACLQCTGVAIAMVLWPKGEGRRADGVFERLHDVDERALVRLRHCRERTRIGLPRALQQPLKMLLQLGESRWEYIRSFNAGLYRRVSPHRPFRAV
ncbi:hypothetical protein [Paraburkholderia kururiensis]|uniref:hypothetical protein n=1 Tax=Paraburkholderia kururiensis TaxID=984307 RepID=UPI00144AF536|nr:hypothetical protein [Paraburkholderia kururiensis]